jgi:hypothetical protein
MHALVVQSRLNDLDAAVTFAREQAVPLVSRAPGLVAAYWVRLADDKGTSIAVFESEEAARAVAEPVTPPPDGSATVDSIEVGEVVART